MIDSHAHVSFEQFDEDREAVIDRAAKAGVTGWIEVGTDVAQSVKALDLAKKYTGRPPHNIDVRSSVGVHPSDVGSLTAADWLAVEKLLLEDEVVAVGEVGLDYYRGGKYEEQLPVLERFVDLANHHNLPVIFHVRDGEKQSAHDDLILFLSHLPPQRRPRGVIHTFSGSWQQAEEYLKLGLYLSFSGVVTYSNAADIAGTAKAMPLGRMLIETDCPFLAPQPHRGKRNEPAYVKLVAEKIAALRETSVTEIISTTKQNAADLFGIVLL